MSENKRIARNMGRIELLAVQDIIKSMLEAGYDRKKIHCRLLEEGRITMSYPTFCYQFKQRFLGGGNPAIAQNPVRRPEPPAQKKAGKSEAFGIDPNPQYENFQ